MKLSDTLDKFAKTLYDKASEKDTPLQESIDAFKALTAYYSAQQRRGKKSDPEDDPDDGFNFANEGPNGGSTKIPGRRNS